MTFDEYINNPAGAKNAVISHREMYRALYSEKLDKIYVREGGDIDFFVYKSKADYLVHIKVPSEVIPKFYYDVVIQFSPKSGVGELSRSVKDYEAHFYSNDPAFVFTFAHAFLKNDLFIKDLIPKMSKLAVKRDAKERNPANQVGYVKSLYFAYLIMENKNLFSKARLDSMAKPYSKKEFLPTVMDADEKVQLRMEAKPEKEKKRKREERQSDDGNHNSTPTPMTGVVSRTKKTATIGRTKRVGRTKRI